ncbi:NUDIX hydrolase [Streptococcus dentapri]|uniref:NUDIX hydrolase n=1 Tax=Streptococcus dentapri TaxID=573564 RepID=A0ABV8CYH8_9STRE
MELNWLEKLKNYQPKPLDEEGRYAVLLPLVWDEQSQIWQVLYQIRSQEISQPGEVSFPGGRVEEGEAFEAAAIRETIEELNVTSDQIEIKGEIDYSVHHHRTIRCFVGTLAGDWKQIRPNANEVDRLFTIPLSDLMKTPPKVYRLLSTLDPSSDFPFERIPQGYQYNFGKDQRKIPFYDLAGENLWGLTAQFTARFVTILQEDILNK